MTGKTSKAKAAKKLEYKLSNDCPNHDKHLCHMVGLRNMKTAGQLSKDAKYLCAICGRAAKRQVNLCAPVKI